jgi:hypothetical protein
MSDVANETISAADFQEKYGGPTADQATLDPEQYDEIVAVDPGTTTGVAILCEERLATTTQDFWALMRRARADAHTVRSLYIVEAPYKTGVTHQRLVAGQNRLGAKLKIAQNAGGVQREAELLVEGLRQLDQDVLEHDPSTSKKWGDDKLRRLIGDWNGPSNSHTRDALLMLVAYGFLPD